MAKCLRSIQRRTHILARALCSAGPRDHSQEKVHNTKNVREKKSLGKKKGKEKRHKVQEHRKFQGQEAKADIEKRQE